MNKGVAMMTHSTADSAESKQMTEPQCRVEHIQKKKRDELKAAVVYRVVH